MSKKTFNSLSLSLFACFLINNQAKADNIDSDSLGLGGVSVGVNNAYSALRNPASIIYSGKGNIILPLSLTEKIDLNTSLSSLTSFSNMDKMSSEQVLGNVSKLLTEGNGSLDINSSTILPIIGYSGTAFSVFDKPVGIGVNVWTKATVKTNIALSKNFYEGVFSAIPLVTSIKDQITETTTKAASLSGNLKMPDLTKYTNGSVNIFDKEQVKKVGTDLDAFQKETITPVLTEGEKTINSLDKITTDVKNVLKNFDSLTKDPLLKGNVVTDGHATLSFSAATGIFKNEFIDLSGGLNLKAFIMPSFSFGNANGFGTLTGGDLKAPVVMNMELQTDKLNSATQITDLLDNQVKGVIDSGKELITSTKELNDNLSKIVSQAKNDGTVNPLDAAPIQGQFVKIQQQSTELMRKVSGDFSKDVTDKIQTSLIEDIKSMKLNITNVTDVAPVGFGSDLGFQALLFNDLTLGLMIENPLVLWSAKSQKSSYSLDVNSLSDLQKFDVTKNLKKLDDGIKQDINYTLSEPMALKFGASYELAKLTPFLSGAKIAGDIEQVLNGNPLAFHLGFEKNWKFGFAGLSLRLGTQLGGLSNNYAVGLGGNLGGFFISTAVGSSNPISPMQSKSMFAGLSTSVRF